MPLDILIRLAQLHDTFRIPELESLAVQQNIKIEIIDYQPESPYCIIRFHPPTNPKTSLDDVVRSFVSRSIMAKGAYELWGLGTTYDDLHNDIRIRSEQVWHQYDHVSFRFSVESFYGKRTVPEQLEIINTFRYLGFRGKVAMKNPDVEFVVFEEWDDTTRLGYDPREDEVDGERRPKRLLFGRFLGGSSRGLKDKHDLKKRPYISTTSMDAELALVTANLALAAPGKLFLDPFVGTGSFMVAASELGALTFGSDIDGRSYRGKGYGVNKGVGANFKRYGLQGLFGDCFTSDLTNTPLRFQRSRGGRGNRWLDGIISDPPYGIREGLKVLGSRQTTLPTPPGSSEDATDVDGTSESIRQPYFIDGVPSHTLPGYIAPKKPYPFLRLLDDILDFAAKILVDKGRLAFWMPSANDADQEQTLPQHPALVLKYVCVQSFNRWSRKLLVYERISGGWSEDVNATAVASNGAGNFGYRADELNPFRKLYFNRFQGT